jgi:hypothetical protein
MFNSIRNRFANKYVKMIEPDTFDKVICGSGLIGLVSGSVYGALDSRKYSNPLLLDTVMTSALGGCVGAVVGLVGGIASPILFPTLIISGVIGAGTYGYSFLEKKMIQNKK